MYVSSVSAATYSIPAKQLSKSIQADYDKSLKTLGNFKELLNKEAKAVKKSKMDNGFKQNALEEVAMQMRLVDDKIQQLTDNKQQLVDNKALNNSAMVKSVAVGYGISYLA
jgi:hypothetical protein